MLPPQGRRVYCSLYLQQPSLPAYLPPWLAPLFPSRLCINVPCLRGPAYRKLSLLTPSSLFSSPFCLPGISHQLTWECVPNQNVRLLLKGRNCLTVLLAAVSQA